MAKPCLLHSLAELSSLIPYIFCFLTWHEVCIRLPICLVLLRATSGVCGALCRNYQLHPYASSDARFILSAPIRSRVTCMRDNGSYSTSASITRALIGVHDQYMLALSRRALILIDFVRYTKNASWQADWFFQSSTHLDRRISHSDH